MYVNPTKAKQVLVILLNTNSYNVWIHHYLGRQTQGMGLKFVLKLTLVKDRSFAPT